MNWKEEVEEGQVSGGEESESGDRCMGYNIHD